MSKMWFLNFQYRHENLHMNHLRRKRLCNPLISNNNLQEEYIKYKISDKIEYPKNTQNVPKK